MGAFKPKRFHQRPPRANEHLHIDAHARRVDLVAHAANVRDTSVLPQLLSFDFAAAFPSLSHAFLFMTLLFHVIPEGLMRFLEALYAGKKYFGVFDGVQVVLYEVRAGSCKDARYYPS